MSFSRFLQDNARYLAAGFLLTFASSFGQTFFISVFAGLIFRDFGISDGEWGAIYAVGTIASAIVMVWSGALTDRFRVRTLSAWVLGGLALACIAMAGLPTVWLLAFVVFALRLFGQGMATHVAQVAMARWYVATRGRALSIAGLGIAVGEAVLPITFVALLTVAPTRALWLIGAAILLLLLPIVHRLLENERTPERVSNETDSVGMDHRHWSRREVLGHWLFWVMVPAVLGPSAFGTAMFFQQVHLAEVKGWTHLELVSVFPVFPLMATVAMIGSGWLIDRIGTAWLMPLAQLPMALAFVIVWASDTIPGAALGIAIMALSVGTNATLPGAFWSEFYGTRHLGAIKALATAVMVLGSAIGPWITGVLIDRGVDFPAQMPAIAVWFLIVGLVVAVGMVAAQRALPQTSEGHVERT